MSDGDLLLAAVLANPEDDSARLVFADWLQEHGGPEGERRANLIRLMCAEPTIRIVYKGRWTDLPEDDVWESALAALDRLRDELMPVRFVVQRGFVSEIDPTLDEFLASAGRWFDSYPITAVRLRDRNPLNGGARWGWYTSFDTDNDGGTPLVPRPHWVGEGLGNLLTGASIEHTLPLVRWYGSEAAAHAALGRACLEFGRAEAARLRARS